MMTTKRVAPTRRKVYVKLFLFIWLFHKNQLWEKKTKKNALAEQIINSELSKRKQTREHPKNRIAARNRFPRASLAWANWNNRACTSRYIAAHTRTGRGEWTEKDSRCGTYGRSTRQSSRTIQFRSDVIVYAGRKIKGGVPHVAGPVVGCKKTGWSSDGWTVELEKRNWFFPRRKWSAKLQDFFFAVGKLGLEENWVRKYGEMGGGNRVKISMVMSRDLK